MRRFAIKRSPWWRPFLALLGATAARAYLEVDRERLVARFGWYRLELPRAQIAAVEPVRWLWWWGIGWKVWRGRLGLIGAAAPVLCLRLANPHRARLLGIAFHLRELCVSVDDPAAVRAALEDGASTSSHAPRPASARFGNEPRSAPCALLPVLPALLARVRVSPSLPRGATRRCREEAMTTGPIAFRRLVPEIAGVWRFAALPWRVPTPPPGMGV